MNKKKRYRKGCNIKYVDTKVTIQQHDTVEVTRRQRDRKKKNNDGSHYNTLQIVELFTFLPLIVAIRVASVDPSPKDRR